MKTKPGLLPRQLVPVLEVTQPEDRKTLVHLQHELHADSVLYQPHHQVRLTLEHLVVLPGQRVGVLDGEVKVWSGTVEKNIWAESQAIMVQKISSYVYFKC